MLLYMIVWSYSLSGIFSLRWIKIGNIIETFMKFRNE